MKSEWMVSTLDDVCEVVTDGAHNSPKSVENGKYMASVKDFVEYGFDFKNCRKISIGDYEKLEKQGCVPKIGDVLVGKDGARYFEDIIIYRQLEKPALLSSIAILRPDYSKITSEFLYYVLKSPAVKKNVKDNYGSGSAIPRIVLKDFKRMPFAYPCLGEQHRITSLCETLDEKIQLNNAVNDNLLQQARALFHQWLSSTTGELHCLSEVANINQETYSPKSNWDSINYLDTSSITDGIISDIQHINPSAEKLPSRARRILKQGDIVFSTVRPNQLHYGIVSNPLHNMLGSTGFAVIRSNVSTIPNEIIYLALTEPSFIEQMQQIAEQSVSTFPSIRPSDLDACSIPEPQEGDGEVIAAIQVLFAERAANHEENNRLSLLRDTLLPKLMSGELDVSDFDI